MSSSDDQQNRAIEDQKMVEDAEEKGISPSLTSSNSMKASPNEKIIADLFRMMKRHSVDLLIEKALCANGVPFNVLRSPNFISMVRGINCASKDYKLPSYDKARTTLLDECKRDLEKYLVPLKDTWFINGVSIISDEWTNIKHKPIINVIASNSQGSVFLYAETFEGIEKKEKKKLKSIDKIVPSNVLQVISDNAANYKAAGKEIEKIVSHHNLLRRVKKCWESLATTVVLMAWNEWVRNNEVGVKNLGEELAVTIRDDQFWEKIDNILAITKPIYYLMNKFSDGEGPKMGDIYEMMDCMLGEITNAMKNSYHVADHHKVQEILVSPSEKMNVPMHCLGFSFNPHFYDANYLRMEAPCGIPRCLPDQDLEVVKGGNDSLGKNW
ncbi:uncharacterized protein LOC141711955 [Apium graveolens]|uniref:uncharacterized protein LOC141711955 n=1 Tax=Apium graveolens TaxID=4045 RepID=UPI003D79AD45